MNDYENKLSDYIDALNEEHKPKEHGEIGQTDELEKLFGTVRLVRSLKKPVLPDDSYPEKLVRSVSNQFPKGRNVKHKRRTWFTGIAAVAAVLVIAVTLSNMAFFSTPNYAFAMERAFQGIKAYHGILEISYANAEGKSNTQAKLEVWADKKGHYYVKQLEGYQKGVVTINNGDKKWQLVPKDVSTNTEGNVVRIFPSFPDPYSFSFELGKEIENIKSAASKKSVGEETIAGRQASVIEVSPQGGEPYRIWVDKETKLPLKKQSALNNGLQYTATYTNIEFNDALPSGLMTYKLPEGFKEVNSNPELGVTNIEEAQSITGITVKLPEEVPSGYSESGVAVETNKNVVKLYYTADDNEGIKVVLLQGKAAGEFKAESHSILGKIAGMQAEIQSPIQAEAGIINGSLYGGVTGLSSIRWVQEGKEYAVAGNASIEILSSFAGSIAGGAVEMPLSDNNSFKPQIEVPVDMDIAKNDQKSVDRGSSPWQLDPAFVAQVFVSLKMAPQGITGEHPVKMENLKVVENNGVEAIIEVKEEKSPVGKVYLKRLVRQDATGIWSAVGYDVK